MSRGQFGKTGVYNNSDITLSDTESSSVALDVNSKIILSGTSQLQGNIASGATDSGNPIKIGGVYNSSPPTLSTGQRGDVQMDANANIKTRETYFPAYEDNTNGVAKVEHQYSYSRKTADGQVKGAAGFVHTVTISPLTATPTAGLVTIYDNTAESGTVIFSEWFFATDPAHTLLIDAIALTGIYVGFDATLANVGITVSYR